MKLRLRDWKFKNFYKSIWNFKEILFLFEKFPRISQRLPAFTNRLLFLFILIRKFCYMEIRCHKILIITPIYFSLQKAGPKPTAQLDRTNDNVYHSTTYVVRSVMALSRSVQQQQSTHYLENVKAVGFELRKLLEAVDQLVPALPISTHREVRTVAHQHKWLKCEKKWNKDVIWSFF